MSDQEESALWLVVVGGAVFIALGLGAFHHLQATRAELARSEAELVHEQARRAAAEARTGTRDGTVTLVVELVDGAGAPLPGVELVIPQGVGEGREIAPGVYEYEGIPVGPLEIRSSGGRVLDTLEVTSSDPRLEHRLILTGE